MNLQQIETFRIVAQLGSFTRAAQQLNATQSTISIRIAELERELGVVLLERGRRRVTLTAKGRDMIRYAEEVSLLLSEMRQQVGNPDNLSGSLQIGVAELVAVTWLPEFLSNLKKRYPRIEVGVEVGMTGQLIDRLEAGEVDIVAAPMDPPTPGKLRATHLGDVEFGFFCAPDMLPDRLPAEPVDLVGHSLITYGPSSNLNTRLLSWFDEGGASPRRIDSSNSMSVASELAQIGMGLTFLPLQFAEKDVLAGTLCAVETKPAFAPVPFYALTRMGRREAIAQYAVDMARQFSKFR